LESTFLTSTNILSLALQIEGVAFSSTIKAFYKRATRFVVGTKNLFERFFMNFWNISEKTFLENPF
jgi:hypothetical protein